MEVYETMSSMDRADNDCLFPILSHTRTRVYHIRHVHIRLQTNKRKWLSTQWGNDLCNNLTNDVFGAKAFTEFKK